METQGIGYSLLEKCCWNKENRRKKQAIFD